MVQNNSRSKARVPSVTHPLQHITDQRFADDINAFAEEEQELEALVESRKTKPAQGIRWRSVPRRPN